MKKKINASIHTTNQYLESIGLTMEYIQKDEYLEITPKSIRMRKIHLEENERNRAAKAQNA